MKLLYIIIIPGIIFGCSTKQKENNQIRQVKSYDLTMPEPSGLSSTFNEDGFWIVSDDNSTVYMLDNYGKVVKKFKVAGEDLEGVTVIDEQTIAVVLERSREVVVLDTSGVELRRKKIDMSGDVNLGLEGITFNSNNKNFYVLNEKKPGLLINLDFELNEIRRDTLNFAKDYSGIFYDSENELLWMVSDESKIIAKTDLNGNLIKKLDIDVIQAEGICVDNSGNRIYLVSDKKEEMYVYEFK